MGRELNFRVWDEDRREYLSGGHVLLAIPQGRGERKTTLFLDQFDGEGDKYKERFIIEQFIGIRDQGGREIYEGDVVECRVEENGPRFPAIKKFRGEVKFDIGTYGIGGYVMTFCSCMKVVGNIHAG